MKGNAFRGDSLLLLDNTTPGQYNSWTIQLLDNTTPRQYNSWAMQIVGIEVFSLPRGGIF